jgi:DNA-binding IclR family transcriptional regulator
LIRSLRDEGFDLSVFELLILNHLRRSSRLTLADAAVLCQQSTEGTRRLLDRLTEQELLLREGSGVEPSWVLGPRAQSSQVPSR